MKMNEIENNKKLKIKKTRGKLQRISGDQLILGRELLLQIALRMMPDDQTQRRFFSNYLPEIYFLKEKVGCTFKSITKYLKEIGLNLSESSVRVYYSDMLPKRLQECICRAEELAEHYKSAIETDGFSIHIGQ
jgi:hypothetical protein